MTDVSNVAEKATSGLKTSTKRLVAFAKKKPVLALLLVGGVVLLAFATKRATSQTGISDGYGAEGGDALGDLLGGGGGGF